MGKKIQEVTANSSLKDLKEYIKQEGFEIKTQGKGRTKAVVYKDIKKAQRAASRKRSRRSDEVPAPTKRSKTEKPEAEKDDAKKKKSAGGSAAEQQLKQADIILKLKTELETKEKEYSQTLKAKEKEHAQMLKTKEKEYAQTLKTKEKEYAQSIKTKEKELKTKEKEHAQTLKTKEKEYSQTLKTKEKEHLETLKTKEKEFSQEAKNQKKLMDEQQLKQADLILNLKTELETKEKELTKEMEELSSGHKSALDGKEEKVAELAKSLDEKLREFTELQKTNEETLAKLAKLEKDAEADKTTQAELSKTSEEKLQELTDLQKKTVTDKEELESQVAELRTKLEGFSELQKLNEDLSVNVAELQQQLAVNPSNELNEIKNNLAKKAEEVAELHKERDALKETILKLMEDSPGSSSNPEQEQLLAKAKEEVEHLGQRLERAVAENALVDTLREDNNRLQEQLKEERVLVEQIRKELDEVKATSSTAVAEATGSSQNANSEQEQLLASMKEEVHSLGQRLDKAVSENATVNMEFSKLQDQLKEANMLVEQNQKELDDIRAKSLAATSDANEKLQSLARELEEAKASTLEAKASTLSEEAERLTLDQTLKALEEVKASSQIAIAEASKFKEQLEAERENLNQARQALDEVKASSLSELADLAKIKGEQATKIAELEKKVNSQDSELQDSSEIRMKLERAEEEAVTANMRQEELHERVSKLQQELAESRERNENASSASSAAHQDLETTISSLKQEKAELESRYQEEMNNITTKAKEAEAVQSQKLTEVQQAHDQLKDEMIKTKAHCDVLRAGNHTLVINNEQLIKEKASLEAKISEVEESHNATRQERTQLMEGFQELEKKKDEELEAMKQKLEGACQERDFLQGKMEDVKDSQVETTLLATQLAEVKLKLAEVTQSCDEVQGKYTRLREAHEQKLGHLQTIEAKLAESSGKCENLESRIAEFETKYNVMADENAKLVEQQKLLSDAAQAAEQEKSNSINVMEVEKAEMTETTAAAIERAEASEAAYQRSHAANNDLSESNSVNLEHTLEALKQQELESETVSKVESDLAQQAAESAIAAGPTSYDA